MVDATPYDAIGQGYASGLAGIPPCWQRAKLAQPPLLHGIHFFLPMPFAESKVCHFGLHYRV